LERKSSFLPLPTREKYQAQKVGHQQVAFVHIAHVFRAALVLGAGGGFLLACVLTVTSMAGVPLGTWWLALAQAHGNLQVFGWAGLFVVGVSLYFLPRLRGAPLLAVWPVRWLIGLQVTALCLRALAQPLLALTGEPFWRISLVGSGILQCMALLGIVLLLGLTFCQGPALTQRPAFGSILPLVLCAFTCLALAGIVNLVNMCQTEGLVSATGDSLFVALGLFGFLLPMALGMSARSLPMYAGLNAFPTRSLFLLASLYISGLLSFCAGLLGGWQGMAGAGMALMGGVLVAFIISFMRIMRTRGKLPQKVKQLAPKPAMLAQTYQAHIVRERGAYGPFVALVASAYLWAALGGILLLSNGLAELLGWTAPFVEDAIRHSLTVGFLSLLICGLAPRMLPGFSGGTIRSAKLVSATLWLGNLAALFRVGSLLLAPWLTIGQLNLGEIAFGCSGILGLALALCLAINIWPALRPART
jgi:uncharacterized protein involved in response to NO